VTLMQDTASKSSLPAVLELTDVPRSDPWEAVRRGSRMLSNRVGIVRKVAQGCTHAQDPRTFSCGIVAADISQFCPSANSSKGGGGGDSLIRALAATLGEAVERYSMFFYDKRKMILASYREVADDAVSPDLLRLYSQAQIDALGGRSRAQYFTEDSRIRWVWGYSLTHERPRLVPASFVYMNYRYGDDEAIIGSNASTGLAAGLTVEEAILVGIYEVVERDAFTVAWLKRRHGRRLIVDNDGLTHLLVDRFHAGHPRVSITAYDLTSDVAIPSIFMVMKRPAEFGQTVCVGTATRLEPAAALKKCCFEVGQAFPYFRFLLGQLKAWQPAADYSDVNSFDHHAIFYTKRPELVPDAFEFLDTGVPEVPLSSMPSQATGRVLADVRRCVDLVRAVGLEVIVTDITTPDVRDIGMRVVRVMIPGMVPLHGVHRYPFLGAKRLAQFRAEGAWSGGDPAAINPYPHPFP
jgi:ribosomal protein S12 methylthiotransferase accessory factor